MGHHHVLDFGVLLFDFFYQYIHAVQDHAYSIARLHVHTLDASFRIYSLVYDMQ